jgi:hypothetical protein
VYWGIAINTDNNYVRPDLPSARDQEAEDEDHDYRRRDRFDVRRGQFSRDEEHLRILSIMYYVFGGLAVFGGLFPLIYVAMGVFIVSGGMGPPGSAGPGAPPPAIGWLLIAIGGGFSLLVLALAGCALFTGYNLSRKKRYMFCFVDACTCCIQVPLGTILGVFTIVVLARPSVKELFDHGPEEAPLAQKE